jgi:hypothetical protein
MVYNSDDEKQPKLRDGFIHSKGQPQAMVFPENYSDHPLRGQPKGAKKFYENVDCGLRMAKEVTGSVSV